MEDETIIGLYWARDERAISETDRKYGENLRSLAYRVCADRQDGDECANDTYLRVWNDIPPTRPDCFRAYLLAIVRRIAFDRLRSRRAEKRGAGAENYPLSAEELTECVPGGTTPEEEFDRQALSDALDAFLRTLPKEQRQIFLCRYWFLDSVKEISVTFGAAETTIKSSLFRTRKALRAYLTKEGIPF